MRKYLIVAFSFVCVLCTIFLLLACDPRNCETKGKEHNFIENSSQNATCTENGNKNYTCSICGYAYNQIVYTTGHSFEKTVVKEATCIENGVARLACKNCDYQYDEIIDALDHVLEPLKIIKPAKCTQEGEGYRHCSRCGIDIAETIQPINHKLDNTKHCVNSDCDYFELFDCSVLVTSQFGSYTKDLALEYGQQFSVLPETYGVNQLKFLGYYIDEEQISDNEGKFLFIFQGQNSLSVRADYYYSIAAPQDIAELQNNPFISYYFANQKNNDFLTTIIENDIDFENADWVPVTINGSIKLDGRYHSIKNYYSTKGGIFKLIKGGIFANSALVKNIVFENANLRISNISIDSTNSDYFECVGILADCINGYVENITVRSGSIVVTQAGDTDLAISGVCGKVNSIVNCKNYADITSNTAISSGIAIETTHASYCVNYGNINTGDYLISPILLGNLGAYYGTSGICIYAREGVNNCINLGEINATQLNASGIVICNAAGHIENCGNYAKISAINGNAAGIVSTVIAGNISQSFNRGQIIAKTYAGGIAATCPFSNINYSWTILNCYNVANIKSGEYAGGIAGYFGSISEPMKNCYNAGLITGKAGCVGGIVGRTGSTSLLKCVNTDKNFSSGACKQNLCMVNDNTDDAFLTLGYDTSIWAFMNDGRPTLIWESYCEK